VNVRDREGVGQALVPILVLIATVSSVISSLGAPLLPTIANVDHVSLSDAQWSLTVTMLVGAVASPVLGRLGDGPARRRVILISLTVVLVGSAVVALPINSFALLLLGRGMQGIGLALVPLCMAVARENLPALKAAPAIAVLSVCTTAAVGLGYPITGLLDETLGLHATFWFGTVVAGIALVLSMWALPRKTLARPQPLDTLGAILLGLALIGILVAVTEGQPWGWTSPKVITLLVIGAIFVVTWIWRERRTSHPLVDLRLLRHPTVVMTNCSALLIGMSLYIFVPLLADFVQTPPSAGYGFGASVLVVGLMLLPFSILTTSMSRVSAAFGRRFGAEKIVPIGALFVVVAAGLFSVADTALWEAFVVMGIAGIGIGFSYAAMPGLIVRSVPSQETGSALGFYQVARYVGFALGSAVSACVLAAYTPAGQTLPEKAGFTVAMGVAAFVALLTMVVSLVLGRAAGVAVSSARQSPVQVVSGTMGNPGAELLME
jgi:MFS family permease